ALANLRVVAIARHVDERRIEAAEDIASQEHAHAPPLVQVDDAARDANQVGDAGLEQLVARIGLENVHEGLRVVARRVEVEMIDDAPNLLREERNFTRAAMIDPRGEQPQEALLARHASRSVERLDADV